MADINPPDRREKARKAAPHGQTGRQNNRNGQHSSSGDHNGRTQRDSRNWPRPPHKSYKQAYAAIDLGTNNCRLLIARPNEENFVVIDAFSRVVRLGEGLAQTGRLSDHAMDRALGALKVCSDKLRKRNVHLARSVATEACRRASNGEAFIERVREETGIGPGDATKCETVAQHLSQHLRCLLKFWSGIRCGGDELVASLEGAPMVSAKACRQAS